MKPFLVNKKTFAAILSGTYTPFELREFVQACHNLALPLIRKKIAIGKLNLAVIGLKETDVVYDCIADLFRRDESGGFPSIRSFIEYELPDEEAVSAEQLTIALRRLIFGKINNNIVRLYAEADPALGKILRNMKLAQDRMGLFDQVTRFSELFLVPKNVDPLWHCSPLDISWLRHEISRTVLVHDTMPAMMKKLRGILVEETEYQRAAPFVQTACVFKEIYSLSWESSEEQVQEHLTSSEVTRVVSQTCRKVRNEMYDTYVGKGKCSEETYDRYIAALEKILLSELTDNEQSGQSYFDHLRNEFPTLTRESYESRHRATVEYLAKIAKEHLRSEMRDDYSL